MNSPHLINLRSMGSHKPHKKSSKKTSHNNFESIRGGNLYQTPATTGVGQQQSRVTGQHLVYHSSTESRTNTSDESANLNLVAGLYEIGPKLGSGSFGEVRLGVNLRNKNQIAIKFEHKSDLKRHLKTEYDVYSTVQGVGFPEIYWFGKHGDYTALVMQKLGPSLKTLYARCNRIFPVSTVAMIAIQLLERLELLHSHGWLHQDLKPENVVIAGSTQQSKYDSKLKSEKKNSSKTSHDRSTVYLIDYGTSAMYIDPTTKQHRIRGPSTKIVGTARYSSLNNHYGYLQSRRDDLESLGYMLVYFLKSRLQWQGINERDFRVKWKKVRRVKRAITPEELTRGLPIQFRIYVKYVFKLSFAQRPNYAYLRGLFTQLLQPVSKNAISKTGNTTVLNGSSVSPVSNVTSAMSAVSIANAKLPTSMPKFAWERFGLVGDND